MVDTRDGHTKKIKGSGEVPEYCMRPDFGKMPAYLVKRNRKIQKALDKMKFAEDNRESLCKLISEQERQILLDVSISYLFYLPETSRTEGDVGRRRFIVHSDCYTTISCDWLFIEHSAIRVRLLLP